MAERRETEGVGEEARPRFAVSPRDHARGPNDAVWDLVRRHEASVAWLAREYRHLGVPFEDLRGEGILGLVEAAFRYDPTRGIKFITYGLWWARKRMCETALRQAGIVRLPRYRLRRLSRVREAEREIAASIGRPPTTEEVAREAGMAVREVEILLGCCRREVSLSDRVGGHGTLLVEETVAGSADSGPELDLLREDRVSLVMRLLERLPVRQRQVLTWRYGLDGARGKTLAEIGALLGLSRERVRQLENSAIVALRRQGQELDRPH